MVAVFSLMLGQQVFAAGASNKALGSVSGAGVVELRGVPAKDSTFFSGDAIRTGSKSYASVVFQNANKLELFNDTNCVITEGKERIAVGLVSGNLAFAASKEPVAITLGNYEVLPSAGTTGGVGTVGPELAGIRVIKGSVTVRNLKNNRSVTVGDDDVQVINLKTDEMNVPGDQLVRALPASAMPSAPLPPPQGNLCRGGWWKCLATPAKVGVISAIGGGAAVTAWAIARDSSPSNP
jgi:hypothetical protein